MYLYIDFIYFNEELTIVYNLGVLVLPKNDLYVYMIKKNCILKYAHILMLTPLVMYKKMCKMRRYLTIAYSDHVQDIYSKLFPF